MKWFLGEPKKTLHGFMLFMTFTLSWLWVGALGADTYPRQPGIDAEHYVFRLDARRREARHHRRSDRAVPLRHRRRHACRARSGHGSRRQRHDGDSGHHGRIDRVCTRIRRISSRSRCPRRRQPANGATSRSRITAYPPTDSGSSRTSTTSGRAFSENWPNRAREWLPMIDHPYDKATSEFVVTAPSKYQVVANGLLQEEIDLGDGRRTTHWKQSVPIASWLNAIGVEQFYVHYAGRVRGVELSTWVAHQDTRRRPRLLRGARAQRARVLQRAHRPVPVREARQRRRRRHRRRHRARQRDLLRRERHPRRAGHRPRRARDRASVVRQRRHRA